VWILSLVSLFTDTASEMLYPIMPLYLQSIGFSIVVIGIIEGIAEATAGLSKGYFGKLSDHTGKRASFIQWGYGLSALSKPLMAVFNFPVWIVFVRTIDRLGKGLRTGARDAMLSDEATPSTKGKIFGFHRSMDTIGAMLGPLIALIFLQYHPTQYKQLFILALIPGIIAIILALLVKDRNHGRKEQKTIGFFSFLNYWKDAPVAYRQLVFGLLFFTLLNSSDVFLLLRLKDLGWSDKEVILVYIFYNVVYALAAYPLGTLADKIGLKRMLLTGLFLFSVVYGIMSTTPTTALIIFTFSLYGIYAAATEGISKAWISNISPSNEVATAIGTYTGLQSIVTMLASTVAGLIWYSYGPAATFMISCIGALAVVFYLSRIQTKRIN
jgi:MFS family permease